jgi:hypothetical protein
LSSFPSILIRARSVRIARPAAVAPEAAMILFSVVPGIAERRRGFDELSLFRVGARGAVAGVLVGLIITPISVPSGVSAAGSLAIARMAEDPEGLHAGANVAEVRKAQDDEQG